MRVVLWIGPNHSTCGKCARNADPDETHHLMETMVGQGCGVQFTHAASGYNGIDTTTVRPDLPKI